MHVSNKQISETEALVLLCYLIAGGAAKSRKGCDFRFGSRCFIVANSSFIGKLIATLNDLTPKHQTSCKLYIYEIRTIVHYKAV